MLLGIARQEQSGDRIVDAIRAGKVRTPILEQLDAEAGRDREDGRQNATATEHRTSAPHAPEKSRQRLETTNPTNAPTPGLAAQVRHFVGALIGRKRH